MLMYRGMPKALKVPGKTNEEVLSRLDVREILSATSSFRTMFCRKKLQKICHRVQNSRDIYSIQTRKIPLQIWWTVVGPLKTLFNVSDVREEH